MGWLGAVEGLVALGVVLVVAPVIGLFLRRRWLSTRGGVFDCALRLRTDGSGTGWATGLARYEAEQLQWFRTFSLSLRPKLVLWRDDTTSAGTRAPAAAEAVVLFSDDQILRLRSRQPGHPRVIEMAMSSSSVTGLMSWLEAAPPGGDRYDGLA